MNENNTVLTKQELLEIIQSAVMSIMQSQENTRINVTKDTTLLHLINISTTGKSFLKSTINLGLSIVDASLSIPSAMIQSEVIPPSLNYKSVAKLFYPDIRQDTSIVITDTK